MARNSLRGDRPGCVCCATCALTRACTEGSRTFIFQFRAMKLPDRVCGLAWGPATMDSAAMIERGRGALPGTKPDCVAPGILDLLEQFGSTVTVQRTGEIYGQGKPTEFCWRILSGCVRTVKLMEDGSRQIGEFLWPGDLFGMDDLGSHEFGADAVTDTTLCRYPRAMVEALAKSHIALALWLRIRGCGQSATRLPADDHAWPQDRYGEDRILRAGNGVPLDSRWSPARGCNHEPFGHC